MALRPWPLTALIAAGAALLTLVVSLVPAVAFAYQSSSLHVALEVAAAMIGLLAAYLVRGRLRETARFDDLALLCALSITALSNLLLAALPAAAPSIAGERFAMWGAIAGRLLGAVLFVVAAFGPTRRLVDVRRAVWLALAGSLAAVGAIALTIAVVGDGLPRGVDPAVSPETARTPGLEGHVSIHVVQVVAFTLFAVAALGFARRAAREGSELAVWLACACVLGAAARIHYFLFPSLYTEWVYTGDLFRFGFYLLLLAGAAREIRRYQRRAADAAVFDERRRLARDLHDGLAQELGFILMQARRRDDALLTQIAQSAERAIDEARRAIAALTRPIDEPLDVAVAQAVEDVAARAGARVRFDLEPEVQVDAAAREELLRIAREAVSNALRHASSDVVTVQLAANDVLRLRISDDGCGFDPEATRVRGHGLTSMRERARAIGGELRIESSPNAGTAVEVLLPTAR